MREGDISFEWFHGRGWRRRRQWFSGWEAGRKDGRRAGREMREVGVMQPVPFRINPSSA